MPLVTTIKWREYPKEKPPNNGWYTTIADEKIERNKFISERKCSEWPYRDPDGLGVVSRFALPGDITTREETT